MFAWITEYYGALIVGAILAAVVAAVIVSLIRKKKKGRSMFCDCGNCSGCPMSGKCGGTDHSCCQKDKS